MRGHGARRVAQRRDLAEGNRLGELVLARLATERGAGRVEDFEIDRRGAAALPRDQHRDVRCARGGLLGQRLVEGRRPGIEEPR